MENLFRLYQNNVHAYNSTARNVIVHSKLSRFSSFSANARLSVKYVNAGTERYQVNDKRYLVEAGEFLLVKERSELGIEFDHQQEAEGFCFFIDEDYIKQALALQKNKACIPEVSEVDLIEYHFLDTKYRIKDSPFGTYLTTVVQTLKTHPVPAVSEDFFLDFTDHLLTHQYGVLTEVERINAVKRSTREELYKRTLLAKTYLDDHVEEKIAIHTLSQIAGLSEVQLHRCFKQLFRQTPHQYQITQKMNHSIRLIQSGKYNLSEVSLICGFTDSPTFSKAFKKHFGVSPSTI